MTNVIENGPWMVRAAPIILNQWAPNVNLTKEDLTKVPIWVKFHDVPMAAFTSDGLSMIASNVGCPIRLDSYTSSMCMESWGRNSFARALIDIGSDQILKDNIVVAIPRLDGSGYSMENVRVEYEWKPPRCDDCKIFGHTNDQCPKQVPKPKDDGFVEVIRKGGNGNNVGQSTRKVQGVSLGKQKSKFVYRPKVVINSEKTKAKVDTHVSTSNAFAALSEIEDANACCEKVEEKAKQDDSSLQVDYTKEVGTSKRDGKAVHESMGSVPNDNVTKLDNLEDDESDVEEVYNETASFMASGMGFGGGGGGTSNLEYFDEDDFYDDYKDQVYDLTEEQMDFCKAFDINLRGQVKKKKK